MPTQVTKCQVSGDNVMDGDNYVMDGDNYVMDGDHESD
jgi:hypothetical protein